MIKQAQEHNCRLTSDIEIFLTHVPSEKCIGVTGTNGKSTTTALITHIIITNGIRAVAIGNIGHAVLDVNDDYDFWVIELSSYQISLLRDFRVGIGATLNITPDHIPESGGLDDYVAIKQRLSENCNYAVLGYDNPRTRTILENLSGNKIGFSSSKIQDGLITAYEDAIYLNGEKLFQYESKVNAQNIAAASAVCLHLGISPTVIALGLKTFVPLAHRNEQIGTIDHVVFINDSKATNAESTESALKQYLTDYCVYWLAGGRMKEGGITTLSEYFPKISHVCLFGEAKDAFAETLTDKCCFTLHQDMQEAFEYAYELASQQPQQQAVVLLSPACASFDQWKNFNERGDAFRSMYNKLKTKLELQVQIRDIADKFIKMSAVYGVSDQTLLDACTSVAGESAFCYFPEKCLDILRHISKEFQEQLTIVYRDTPLPLRIRDKIHTLVMQQLKIYTKHKNYREFLRAVLKFALCPSHIGFGLRMLNATVSNIWRLSGDQSTDFSYYTKRASLGLVYLVTLIYFIDDYSDGFVNTEKFLERRINNTLFIAKIKNSFKKIFA